MSDTKGYKIKKKLLDDTFAIPRKLLSRLSEAGSCELKIFLIMASMETDDAITEDAIVAELERAGVSSCDLSEGLAFLRGAGLIEKSSVKKGEASTSYQKEEKEKKEKLEKHEEKHKSLSRPTYTSKQLAEAASGGGFRELVEWASNRLGKTFNTSDLSTLYSFSDYLCLPDDVIMLGIEHCVSEGKASLRYVEKLLIDFADREINTYQKAEEYILKRTNYLSFEGKMRAMMGLGQRALTSKEKAMLSAWQEWQSSEELIRLAYEKTVEKTGRVSMSYMHKILESWHISGFKTVSEVETGDKKPSTDSSFDPDEFFKAALEKSME